MDKHEWEDKVEVVEDNLHLVIETVKELKDNVIEILGDKVVQKLSGASEEYLDNLAGTLENLLKEFEEKV